MSESWQREQQEKGRGQAAQAAYPVKQFQKCHWSPSPAHFFWKHSSLLVITPCSHHALGKARTRCGKDSNTHSAHSDTRGSSFSIPGSEGWLRTCQLCHTVGKHTTACKNLRETPQSCDKIEGHLKLTIPCRKREQLGKAFTRALGFLFYQKLAEKSSSRITVCSQYRDRAIPRRNQGSTAMKRFTE